LTDPCRFRDRRVQPALFLDHRRALNGRRRVLGRVSVHNVRDVLDDQDPEFIQRSVPTIQSDQFGACGGDPLKKCLDLLLLRIIRAGRIATVEQEQRLAALLVGFVRLGELVLGSGLIRLLGDRVRERRAHAPPQNTDEQVALVGFVQVTVDDHLSRLAYFGGDELQVLEWPEQIAFADEHEPIQVLGGPLDGFPFIPDVAGR